MGVVLLYEVQVCTGQIAILRSSIMCQIGLSRHL